MSTTPLKLDIDEDIRPRDWLPRKKHYKGPLRLIRLCVLGAFLPAALVAGPIYLRYRVYSEQVYPLAVSDQRMIDRRVSTTWCQRQVVRVNATFNAYLMKDQPKIERETKPISMTRHLILEDDMKEYWGFYLLRGSSATVSTCVRWPGASLTIIRGHKHLHECAFIGDDSSEELEELVEAASDLSFLNKSTDDAIRERFFKQDSPSNIPEKMKRAREEVRFHEKMFVNRSMGPNGNDENSNGATGSHELDAATMRKILTSLLAKTMDTKRKQKEMNHHHYEGIYKESSNIVKPPVMITATTTTSTTMRPTAAQPEVETSDEIFREVLKKLNDLGDRGDAVLRRLADEIDRRDSDDGNEYLKDILGNVTASNAKQLVKRQLSIKSQLMEGNSAEDAAVEEEDLFPDGIAQDRGTVNETTLNDRSNSEFWSSFSSSEERLLECKGLILNLPLNPHTHCTPRHEAEHTTASMSNTITYRVPVDGYYFFIFNSENEIQPNYVRIKFDLVKTVYDTSNPIDACQNITDECSLSLNFFSYEKTVLELPANEENEWNEEYVVVSTCEPRTAVYLICIISVPLLILVFAFH